MKQRHYTRFMAWIYGLGAVMFLFSPLFNDDEDMLFMGPLLAVFTGYASYRNFKSLKYIHKDDEVYKPPAHSTPKEKAAYYKQIAWMGLVAFAGLSIINILDLNSLESGEVESVSLVAPIGFLYRKAGYWVAILATPILGTIMFLLMRKKLKQMAREEEQ